MIAKVAEFFLVYAKNSSILKEKRAFNTIPLGEMRVGVYSNPDNDPRGPWSTIK
jgi:adenine-specific DNA-methyltransferase